MSLEATIAKAISLHSITTISSSKASSINITNTTKTSSSSNSSCCNYKKEEDSICLQQQEDEEEHHNKSEHSSILRVHKKAPSSGQQQNQSHRHQQHKTKRPAPKPPHSSEKELRVLSARTLTTISKPPSSCHLLVEQILHTVGELEHTLIEDHQTDFELRLALERQKEQVHDLRSSLEMEKKRNQRLVQLIRGVDSSSTTDDEELNNMRHNSGVGSSAAVRNSLTGESGIRYSNSSRWQSRSSMDAFESISPLLMQQRYDELSTSYKQCRRQLVKKEKLLTRIRCEKEDLQGQYDHLLDEYRNVQKRFEELCCKYLRLQAKKNQEIQKLREALSYASDCVLSAQQVMEYHESDANCCMEFRQNLEYFIKALRLCEWVQHCETQRYK